MSLNRGFAALPILIIISLLSGGALLLLAGNTFDTRQSDIEVQEANRADVTAAINGFALAYSRTPCPDTDADGLEDCSETQTSGYVPYVTLGIADERIGELAYAPYQKSTDEGLSSTSNVREIPMPDTLPAGVTYPDALVVPANPPGEDVTDPANVERAQIIYLLEGFYSGLITNTAVRPSLLFATSNPAFPECVLLGIDCFPPLAGPVSNRYNQSYIDLFKVYLAPNFTTFTDVPVWTDGAGDHDFNYSAGYAGNTNYDEVKSLTDNLQSFALARQTKEIIGDDPQIIETTDGNPTNYDLPGRINALNEDILRINAGETIPTGTCGTLDCVYTRWNSYRDEYNGEVTTYNAARLPTTDPLVSNTFTDPDLDGTSGVSTAVRMAALSAGISDLQASVDDGISILNQTIIDAVNGSIAGTPDSKVKELRVLFFDIRNRAQAAINFYNAKINEATLCIALSIPSGCTLDAADLASFTTTRDLYQKAYNLYNGLYFVLYNLNLDLTSSDIQVFADRLDELAPDDTSAPSLPADSATSTCESIGSQTYEKGTRTFNQAECEAAVNGDAGAPTLSEYIDSLGDIVPSDPATVTPETTAVSYDELTNLADLCYKTQQLPTATTPSLASNGIAAAYLLVVPGDNRKIDTDNLIAASILNTASPAQAKTLTYDDNVLVMSPDELDNRFACAGLLNAYESYDTAIKEIALLYDDAVSALGDAEQDQTVAIISLALATAQLAVDVGAIVQETIAAISATAACAGSLGLLANACIAAGLEYAATAAHILTVVADTANIVLAAAALADAISSLTDAQTAKDAIQAHYAVVVNAAIAADGRGGVQEFP